MSGFSRVTFTFQMRRKALYYIANLVIPCCMLSCIAVVAFILPQNCYMRLTLCTYNNNILAYRIVMFYFWCIFLFASHFTALRLRAASADCLETLTRDWKCLYLDNKGLKTWGSPNFFFFGGGICFLQLSVKSPSSLDRLPRNFATWSEMRAALKVR